MTNKELEAKLNKLTDIVSTLVEAMPRKLELKVEDRPTEVVEDDEARKLEKVLGGVSEVVPQGYRDELEKVLNKEFGIHIKSNSDSPTFKFTILVPLKYASLTDADIKSLKADIRPKIVSNSNAIPEVKEWCEKVWNSFGPDMKLRIEADRNGSINK